MASRDAAWGRGEAVVWTRSRKQYYTYWRKGRFRVAIAGWSLPVKLSSVSFHSFKGIIASLEFSTMRRPSRSPVQNFIGVILTFSDVNQPCAIAASCALRFSRFQCKWRYLRIILVLLNIALLIMPANLTCILNRLNHWIIFRLHESR